MIFHSLNCLGSLEEYQTLVFPLYKKYGKNIVDKAMSILSDKRLDRESLWELYNNELAQTCAKLVA